MNILVTCGGGFQGLTLQKELSNLDGINSYVIDINKNFITKFLFDFYEQSPSVKNESEYILFLERFSKENKIQFIIPATSIDIQLLSRNKEKWKNNFNCEIIVPDIDILNTFLDKKATLLFLREKGISVQQELEINKNTSFPIIGKERWAWGGKGILIYKNKKEFIESEFYNSDNYIWLSYLSSFIEFSIDLSVNASGVVSLPVVRTRDAVSGGFAVISSTIENLPASLQIEINKISKLFSDPSYLGIYNIQILYNEEFCYVSDVNPRIGTSAVASFHLGKSLLSHIIQPFLEKKPKPSTQITFYRQLQEKIYLKKDFSEIKNVVFDLDGTLISERVYILERCKALYRYLNSIFIDYNEFLIICESILNEGKASILIDEICRIYKIENQKDKILSIYREFYPNKLSIYKDVYPILYKLNKSSFNLFALTDGSLLTQSKKWEIFPYNKYFKSIIFTSTLGKSKPNLDVFQEIISIGKGNNKEYVMVGDNYYRDSKGAINAGFATSFHIYRQDGLVSPYFSSQDLDDNIIKIDTLNDLSFYFNLS